MESTLLGAFYLVVFFNLCLLSFQCLKWMFTTIQFLCNYVLNMQLALLRRLRMPAFVAFLAYILFRLVQSPNRIFAGSTS